MKLNNLVTFLIGIIIIVLAIDGISNGEIGGIGLSGASNMITRQNDPLYFWLSVIFFFFVGLLFIKSSFKEHVRHYKNPFDLDVTDVSNEQSNKKKSKKDPE